MMAKAKRQAPKRRTAAGTHTLSDRATIGWHLASDGFHVYDQDILHCSRREWAKFKNDPRYDRWQVAIFGAFVVAISPTSFSQSMLDLPPKMKTA